MKLTLGARWLHFNSEKKIKYKFGKGRGEKKAKENIDNICFLMGSLFARSVFQWGEWIFFLGRRR